jgi:hypothetical protein
MPVANNHFLTSGIIAVTTYILFVGSILYYIIGPTITKITSFNKSTTIELDLTILDKAETPKSSYEKPKVNEEVQKEEKAASKETVTKTDMKSLFANVTTEAKTVEKKEVTTNQSVKVASVFKSTFEKEERKEISTNVTKRLENVNLNPTASMAPPSDANVDEYYSLVYEILASKWNPSNTSSGLGADVLITIYKNGKFNYNIVSKSGDKSFDSALESFLNSQMNEKFPPHQKGDKTTLKVTFKTKGD